MYVFLFEDSLPASGRALSKASIELRLTREQDSDNHQKGNTPANTLLGLEISAASVPSPKPEPSVSWIMERSSNPEPRKDQWHAGTKYSDCYC